MADETQAKEQLVNELARLHRRVAELEKLDAKQRGFEQALCESEERFRVVADLTYDWEYWIGVDGKCLYVSPSCERISGYRAEEFMARPELLQEIVHPADRPLVAGHLAQELGRSDPCAIDFRILTPSGERRWIGHVCQPVYGRNGEWLGRRASNRDISARKRVEEALQEAHDELREQVERQSARLESTDRELHAQSTARQWAEQALWDSEARFRAIFEGAAIGIALVDMEGRPAMSNPALQRMLGYSGTELRHMAFREFVHPDDAERDRELYQELVEGKRDFFQVENRYVRRDGQPLWGRLTASLIRGPDGEPLYVVAMAEDITEHKRTLRALHRSVEETARSQRLVLALSEAAQAVHIARTVDEIYRAVGKQVRRLGYHATIFALTDDRAHLTVAHVTFESALLRAAEELTGFSARGYRFPLAPGGFMHRIVTQGVTAFSAQDDEAVAEALPQSLRPLATRLMALLGWEQSIVAPLTVDHRPYGLLAITGAGLTEADVPAVTAFANQAAVAIENAQLLDAVRKQEGDLHRLSARLIGAQEAERGRISRELHDEIGQALTAMSIDLAQIDARLPPEADSELGERLRETRSLVDETSERVSQLSLDLRPGALDDLGLVPALRWYVSRYIKRLGIEVDLVATGLEGRLAPEVETTVYRVAQEALTNVARHAHATRVCLRLERRASSICAVIQDDGQGFAVEEDAGQTRPERGAGLLGIRERVALLGGSFHIESRPGEGTRLSIEIPL